MDREIRGILTEGDAPQSGAEGGVSRAAGRASEKPRHVQVGYHVQAGPINTHGAHCGAPDPAEIQICRFDPSRLPPFRCQ